MGSIFKKTYTRTIPSDAARFTRGGVEWAKWRGRDGQWQTGRVTGAKVTVETGVYYVKYRDASGIVRETATGCRSKDGARAVLAELEGRREKIRSGIVTQAETDAADWGLLPLCEHIEAWTVSLRGQGRTTLHARDMAHKMGRLVDDCRWFRLRDMNRGRMEKWLAAHSDMPPRTRNGYLGAAIAFSNCCIRAGRLTVNPFLGIEKANQEIGRVRVRRALSTQELTALLDAARQRPLHDALYKNRGPVELSAGETARLTFLGEERRTLYLTLATTGLRKNELTRMRIADARLDGPACFLELRAEHAKNRKTAKVPLRGDVAALLGEYLTVRLKEARRGAQAARRPIPAALDLQDSLIPVPDALVKVFRRDLAFAGIPERDARGRVVDVHALRTTFASHLAAAGVPLRTAQELMRHSSPVLTSRVYQDVALLDTAGAVESLPDFVGREVSGNREKAAANLALNLAPDSGKRCHFGAIPGRTTGDYALRGVKQGDTEKSQCLQGLSRVGNSWQGGKAGTGAGGRTQDLWIHNLAAENQNHLPANDLENPALPTCAESCTSFQDSVHGTVASGRPGAAPDLAALAQALAKLSDGERAALTAMLEQSPSDEPRGDTGGNEP